MSGLYSALIGMGFLIITALSISEPAHRMFHELTASGVRYRDDSVFGRVFIAFVIGYSLGYIGGLWRW